MCLYLASKDYVVYETPNRATNEGWYVYALIYTKYTGVRKVDRERNSFVDEIVAEFSFAYNAVWVPCPGFHHTDTLAAILHFPKFDFDWTKLMLVKIRSAAADLCYLKLWNINIIIAVT